MRVSRYHIRQNDSFSQVPAVFRQQWALFNNKEICDDFFFCFACHI